MSIFASKKIMKLDKQEFTESQALGYCFSLVNSKDLNAKDYNRLRAYKRRYANNELGIRAKEKVLIFFGFELIEKVYKKK